MKIVINRDFGGFGLSEEAAKKLGVKLDDDPFYREQVYVENEDLSIESANTYAYRADPRLVAIVEEMGEAANGRHADLKVVEIPDDVQWEIEEYDGVEWIAEAHRTWR